MYTEMFFKKLYKTTEESISSNVTELFYSMSTQRALKRYLGTQRALERHSKDNPSRAVQKHSNSAWALKALAHSSI